MRGITDGNELAACRSRKEYRQQMKIQKAVLKETGFVAAGAGAGTVLMVAVFAGLHKIMPASVPMDAPVAAGAAVGFCVAVLNFFLMGLAVQKVAGSTNEDFARRAMTVSYRYRTLMQLLWCVLAFALPVFNAAAGIIPLFIPSVLIKARGILSKGRGRQPSAGEERGDIHKEQQDGETKEVDAQV